MPDPTHRPAIVTSVEEGGLTDKVRFDSEGMLFSALVPTGSLRMGQRCEIIPPPRLIGDATVVGL